MSKKKIGILVSKRYGAGWSTWGDRNSALDQELVEAFTNDYSESEILKIGKRNWPDQYQGGLLDCQVYWVDEGTLFRIEEYDGYESISFADDGDYWSVAK